ILGVFAFLGFYLAGSRMVEPVRVEVDTPDTHRLLPWPWGILLILHCVTPVAVLTCLAWVGLGVVTIGGWLTAPAAVALALVTPFGAAAIVTPAAISAARRPFPVENLVSGNESGPFMLILFLVAGPALAAIAANIGFGMLRGTLDQGVTGATFSAIFFLATATGLFVTWLGTRKAPE
ncbi:MAG: hypothetical protein KDB69_07755, partial [Acidimicrobiia bacterium]|nr:hypothetical protein [Acidimicrobiia bacterium]